MRSRSLAVVCAVAGVVVCGWGLVGSSAWGQNNDAEIVRLRRQFSQPVTAASPLADRLFVRLRTRSWLLSVDLAMPQPGGLNREINPRDFFNPGLPGVLVNPLNPNQPLGSGTATMRLEQVSLFFPVPERTAGHEFQTGTFDAQVNINGVQAISNTSRNMPAFVSGREGSRFAKWELPDGDARRVQLQMTVPMGCWSLTMDERVASEVDWPPAGKEWAPDAQSALEPAYLVDFVRDRKQVQETQDRIDALLKRWLGSRDPKSMRPVALARLLSGLVMENFTTINTSSISGGGAGAMLGFRFQTAGETINAGRGTEAQVVQLLSAVLRRVGIPARTVFGVETRSRVGSGQPLRGTGRTQECVWLEFAVMDPASGGTVWVPVDIVRQRSSSSRAPAEGRPWNFLGHHSELEFMLPISFQMHPPLDVSVSGLPAFWGWSSPKGVPAAFHGVSFNISQQNSRDRDTNNPDPAPPRRR